MNSGHGGLRWPEDGVDLDLKLDGRVEINWKG